MKSALIVSVALMVAGCGPQSALTPGSTPRDVVNARFAELTKSSLAQTVPQKQMECFVSAMNEGLTDAEMQRVDKLFSTTTPDGESIATGQLLNNAAAKAQQRCGLPVGRIVSLPTEPGSITTRSTAD